MHESKHGVMKIKYAERGVFVRFILHYPNLFCVYVEIILASQLKHKFIECILIELYSALVEENELCTVTNTKRQDLHMQS